MNKNDVSKIKSNAKFKDAVKLLYGEQVDLTAVAKRYQELYTAHARTFSEEGMFFSSPGRIEVCGNHTDHNNGKVLCASITVDTIAFVSPNNNDIITVNSYGYPPVTINIKELTINKREEGSSEALVRGVCRYFVDNGYNIGGFYASTTSNVFKGAGVSSSASFEVLVCEILNTLYNDGKIDKMTKAKASHYAESVYFGKPCGLLDQSAIALGGVSYIDFEDTKNPKVETIDWKFDCDIVLINTGGDHCNLTDNYASIRMEMEKVAEVFNKSNLRELSEIDFASNIPVIQKEVSGRAILRAMHFYNENKRVEKGAIAIKNADFESFAEYINQSGESSYKLLQNCYPDGDVSQRIPLAINLSKEREGVRAVRVHGGGFMGTIIAYVDNKYTCDYTAYMKEVFGEQNVFVIGVRNIGTCKVDL